ncbi:hypothetical protein OsJ_22002 [Oryza sativa Japonica Group]|uniref:Uncharacterized protein n=1 Tax=Oryza sativa subsp. japonica TaxID=39947 RepID=B9FPY8_ORYSJ|nr:hypothetical protein OsJ_22002 [Oryza sativa Japonica Group]
MEVRRPAGNEAAATQKGRAAAAGARRSNTSVLCRVHNGVPALAAGKQHQRLVPRPPRQPRPRRASAGGQRGRVGGAGHCCCCLPELDRDTSRDPPAGIYLRPSQPLNRESKLAILASSRNRQYHTTNQHYMSPVLQDLEESKARTFRVLFVPFDPALFPVSPPGSGLTTKAA